MKGSPRGRDRAVAELAARQHGVVSVRQLQGLGLTQDAIAVRLRAGRLHRLHRGVYAVGHTALTRRSRELAAVLACGPDALLSHRSAAALQGLIRAAGAIEVTAPRSRRPREGIVLHRSRLLHPEEHDMVEGIPVTSVGRTLADLAEVLDERRLAGAVHEAEVARLFDLDAVKRAFDRVPGRTSRARLERALTRYEPEPFIRSEAERRFLELCGRHGLPIPRVNSLLEGREVDFLWPDARLAVEVDGGAAHLTRRAFHEDRRRDRELAALGVQVVRITWRDLTDHADRVAADLRIMLARRG